MRRSIWSAAVAVGAGMAMAGTVTIAPGSGVSTNVAARIAGETDVVVNGGESGGGIVRLNPINTYSGTTALGCGTLVADNLAPSGHASSLGSSGLVSVGRGTFRYVGPAGGWTDRPFTNDTYSLAAIYDISNDLTIASDIVQARGSFVKTGPGTLRLAGPGYNRFNVTAGLADGTSGLQARFVPNANGDAPAKGYRGFQVLEGTLVIGEGGGTYSFGGANNLGMGGWTAADGEQEKEGTLEIAGGSVTFGNWIMHGCYNGTTNTTPERLPQSTFRVTGGDVVCTNFSLGRNKIGYAGFPQLSAPRLEVRGGTMTGRGGLYMSDDRGARSTVEVTGGSLSFALESNTGRCSGSADTTNNIVVSGSGALKLAKFQNTKDDVIYVTVTNGGTMTMGAYVNALGTTGITVADGGTMTMTTCANTKGITDIRVRDGGTLSMTSFTPTAGTSTISVVNGTLVSDQIVSSSGWLDIFLDGCVWEKRSASDSAIPPDNGNVSFTLGAGGMTIRPGLGKAFVIRRPIQTAAGLERDGGITIEGATAASSLEFGTLAQTYTGPTVLKSGTLGTRDTGALPPATDLVVAGGTLSFFRQTQTVRTATFGTDATAPKLGLCAARGLAPLAVTDGVTVRGRPSLSVTLYDVTNATAAAVAGGTFPLVSAPVASRAALETLAANAVLASPAAAYVRSVSFDVADDGATATLAVTFVRGVEATEPATAADATVGYTTLGGAADDAEVPGNLAVDGLAGADIVGVNTNATGCGTVTVSNVSAEFTGKVVTGSGTVVMDSLAWVRSADQLVLGPGTLKYTGTGETVTGLTLNAGSAKASILDVANDLTLGSVQIGTSALVKTGAGDLFLKGPGAFNLANTSKSKGAMNGIGVYGDSPADTFHITVADGRLVIGEEGGGEEEPQVVISGQELDIGGCTASGANGRLETAGELVVKSGTLACSILQPGYYTGSNGAGPEGGVTGKVTICGGLVKPGATTIGYDNMQTHVLSSLITMSGGRFETGTINFQSTPGDVNCPPSTTWIQTGGTATCTAFTSGQYAIGGSSIGNNGAWGPGRMTLTNCTFAVFGTMNLKNGTDTEIDVLADATFTAGTINGSGSASSVIRFAGGLWRPYVPATGNTMASGLTHLYLTRRTTLDTSDDRGLGLPQRYWYYLNQKVEADPGSEEEDIGLTIVGGGTVAVGTAFSQSTLTGPVRVADRSTILPLTTALGSSDVVVEPGSSLRQYNNYATVSNLTLGADGAAEPVLLDVNQEKDNAKKQHNFIVTGDLDIRSPVAFRTHPLTTYQAFDMEACTFTGLVCRADIDLDLAKFTVPRHPLAKTTTYKIVTVPSGTYAGWKALVVTIAATANGTASTPVASGRVWTATSAGGSWRTAANWNGEEPPDGADEQAAFMPAAAANVPVAVDGPTTVGGLSLAGGAAANGYMFSGGLLEVATARAGRSLPIVAASGAHTFASPVALGTRTLVDTSVGASIVFAGGVSANSTVLVVNRGHATGGGEVAVHDPQGLAILATGCGRTVVDNLGFVTASNKLEIGRGTLRYTGPDATIAGFRLVNGAGYPAVLDISEGRTLGVKAITASGTAFVKIGAGCLKFTGNGTFTLGDVTHDFASYATVNVAANGDSPTSGHRRFTLSQGRVVQGTAGDPNDAPTVVCTDFCIGNDSVSGEDCEYVMNNGLLNVGSHYIDYYHGGSKLGRTTFTMNGGTITSSWVRTVHSGNKKMYTMPRIVINGGEWIDKGSLVMGYQKIQQAGYTSTMEVNGGRMSVGGTFYLVYHDQTATGNSNKTTDGLLVVNGGELDVKGPLDFCRAASNVGTVWLNGGVFAAENVTMTRGKGYLYFNGGTYAPHGAEDANSTLAGITAAYVTTNGAVISTANAGGGEYTVAQPLLHDPALAGADGGLVKTGGGLLTLAGENTYTGPTAVEGGTLLIAGSVASDELVLRGDGSIDMGGGTMTFANVTALDGALAPQAVNGTLRVGGRLTVGSLFSTTNLAFATGATLAMDAGGLLLVDGDLTCEGALTVDFGRTEEDPLEYGMKIPLAEVTGTVTLPRRIVAANVGIDPVQLAASVENEVLCVTVASRGMTLVIR